MSDHSPQENNLTYTAPDGTFQESSLDYLSQLVINTGGGNGNAIVNKFRYNTDIDTASSPEIVASWGGSFNPATDVISTLQQFTIVYNNTTDGASGTGARMLQIDYIDENFEAATGFHTLGSTGGDITSFSGYGINRAVVVSLGGDLYNNNDITIAATVDATTQAMIPAEKSVTQQCIYHTPINTKLDLNFVYASVLKISGGGGNPTVNITGYSYSRVTGGRYAVIDIEVDTQLENNVPITFPEPVSFGGREVIYFEATTDVNNTKVSLRFSGVQSDV